MRVTPSPSRGAVLGDRDRPRRALRVSAHPELGVVVLSTWDGDRCTATVRLDPADVPDLLAALATGALDAAGAPRSPRSAAGTRRLPRAS